MDSPATGISPTSVLADWFSAVTIYLAENPNLIAVTLIVTLVPLIYFVDRLGKEPAINTPASSKEKIAAIDAAREASCRRLEEEKKQRAKEMEELEEDRQELERERKKDR